METRIVKSQNTSDSAQFILELNEAIAKTDLGIEFQIFTPSHAPENPYAYFYHENSDFINCIVNWLKLYAIDVEVSKEQSKETMIKIPNIHLFPEKYMCASDFDEKSKLFLIEIKKRVDKLAPERSKDAQLLMSQVLEQLAICNDFSHLQSEHKRFFRGESCFELKSLAGIKISLETSAFENYFRDCLVILQKKNYNQTKHFINAQYSMCCTRHLQVIYDCLRMGVSIYEEIAEININPLNFYLFDAWKNRYETFKKLLQSLAYKNNFIKRADGVYKFVFSVEKGWEQGFIYHNDILVYMLDVVVANSREYLRHSRNIEKLNAAFKLTLGELKNKKIKLPIQIVDHSQHNFFKMADPHIMLLSDIDKSLTKRDKVDFSDIISFISIKSYTEALRHACHQFYNPRAMLLIKLLIEYKEKLGIKINEQSWETHKDTVLHIAARNNKPDLYDYLLVHGANGGLENLEGRVPHELFPKETQLRMMMNR